MMPFRTRAEAASGFWSNDGGGVSSLSRILEMAGRVVHPVQRDSVNQPS